MREEKVIETLNDLITINNDRIEGYETALKESEEADLKGMFTRFMSTSQKCKQELAVAVHELGGEPAEGTKMSGKFFRAWMDVKAAITGKDRKTILDSCLYGEEQALETYEKVLEDDLEYMQADHRTMIVAQKSFLKADHDHVKAMHDSLVDA